MQTDWSLKKKKKSEKRRAERGRHGVSPLAMMLSPGQSGNHVLGARFCFAPSTGHPWQLQRPDVPGFT